MMMILNMYLHAYNIMVDSSIDTNTCFYLTGKGKGKGIFVWHARALPHKWMPYKASCSHVVGGLHVNYTWECTYKDACKELTVNWIMWHWTVGPTGDAFVSVCIILCIWTRGQLLFCCRIIALKKDNICTHLLYLESRIQECTVLFHRFTCKRVEVGSWFVIHIGTSCCAWDMIEGMINWIETTINGSSEKT